MIPGRMVLAIVYFCVAAALFRPMRVDAYGVVSRRGLLSCGTAAAIGICTTPTSGAWANENKGNLDDLPPDAARSYLQYRVPLQTAADFYVFEVQELLKDPQEWGAVGELFQVNNNRGQGNPSRIEREFTNVFRILGLSMPPDIADELRTSQFRFEAAAGRISKTTSGIRRDLPVELDSDAVPKAMEGWEDGRKAINGFFETLNEATGLSEMKSIPPPGANQLTAYGRSKRRYLELKKKVKLCQNRGGPTLAVAWGQLMVSGKRTSCSIVHCFCFPSSSTHTSFGCRLHARQLRYPRS